MALVALADHADARGEVAMSQRDLAARCRVSKSRANTLLAEFLDTGIVTVTSTGGGCGSSAKYKNDLRDQRPEKDTGGRADLDAREAPELDATFVALEKRNRDIIALRPGPETPALAHRQDRD